MVLPSNENKIEQTRKSKGIFEPFIPSKQAEKSFQSNNSSLLDTSNISNKSAVIR